MAIARDWKVTGFREKNLGASLGEAILDAISNTKVQSGFFISSSVPILEDIQLERKLSVEFEVCRDECGKETFREELRRKPTNDFREVYFSQSGKREGSPIWMLPGIPQFPTMRDRWGFEIQAATGGR